MRLGHTNEIKGYGTIFWFHKYIQRRLQPSQWRVFVVAPARYEVLKVTRPFLSKMSSGECLMRIPRAAAHERVIAAACLRHVVSSEVHLGEARVKYGIHENVAYVIVEIVHLHKDMKWENI